ncbi:MAG TPA: cation diffusion facilitator family transporter [Gaiellaceae bacterium]
MHSHGSDRRRLGIALALILALMGGEIAAGIVAHSLALLADAGHMLTDAAALGAALVAAALAARPARGAWTFGFRRAEILAAQGNGVTLLLVALWIVYAAVRRLVSPPNVHGGIVLVLALAGVVVNLAATLVLAGADRSRLNVRGAFLHVATDLAAFAGTGLAGGLILATGWNRFDPIASLAVAALMVRSSWSLLRESGRIFLEAAPLGVDPDAVATALAADPDVVEVHDLHVWTVTSGFPALSAHVLVSPGADCHGARRRLEHLLEERFGLRHTTLQVDHVARRAQVVSIERRGPER